MAEPKENKHDRVRKRLTAPMGSPFSYRQLRKLERIDEKYEDCARVDGIKAYVEEILSYCEAEIEAGRLSDEPQFWGRLYSTILVSVKGRTNALHGSRALYLMRTGGGRPGERGTFEEDQRELSRFVAKIERKLASAQQDSGLEPSLTADTRRSFIEPLLHEKGWSIHDWAGQSNVDHHTADNYLKGKSNPYPSTRRKLAKALGIDELPA